MSNSKGAVRFKNGEIWYYKYYGCSNAPRPALYRTHDELKEKWNDNNYGQCDCEVMEKVDILSTYGDSWYFTGVACRKCKIVYTTDEELMEGMNKDTRQFTDLWEFQAFPMTQQFRITPELTRTIYTNFLIYCRSNNILFAQNGDGEDKYYNERNKYFEQSIQRMELAVKEAVDKDIQDKMSRADGDCVCNICKLTYKEHPISLEVLRFYPDFYLYNICSNILAKL